ncbi:MAG: hypothetical protein K0Q55_1825 [Verrucomicrobia bacterium]|jgi:hypothetical protein|nr:hypothetical protein [Verrucomicrobiota bacterium]
MKMLEHIMRVIGEMARQVWYLPQTVRNVVRRREAKVVVSEQEAERLDRIRNPSKYRGK